MPKKFPSIAIYSCAQAETQPTPRKEEELSRNRRDLEWCGRLCPLSPAAVAGSEWDHCGNCSRERAAACLATASALMPSPVIPQSLRKMTKLSIEAGSGLAPRGASQNESASNGESESPLPVRVN